jgi:hypothetical protein
VWAFCGLRYVLFSVVAWFDKIFARLGFAYPGFFAPSEKFIFDFPEKFGQKRVLLTSNYRGGKTPYRARSPPPFLGCKSISRKRDEGYRKIPPPARS